VKPTAEFFVESVAFAVAHDVRVPVLIPNRLVFEFYIQVCLREYLCFPRTPLPRLRMRAHVTNLRVQGVPVRRATPHGGRRAAM